MRTAETDSPPLAAWLLVALIACAAAAKPILSDTIDPDLFWHLRVADQLLIDGVGPLIDRISFGSDKTPWTPYSWLAELGMGGIWDVGGYRLTIVVTSLLSVAFVGFIALAANEAARQRGGDRGLAVALGGFAAAFLSIVYLSFRPVLFALVLLSLINWLLWRDRRLERSRAVWCVPALLVICVNVHLFAAIGALLVTLRWIADRTRRNAVLLAASLAALLMTPMLPGVVATAWHYQSTDAMVAAGLIAEMWPFYAGAFGIASAVIVVLMFAVIAARRRSLALVDAAAVVCGLVLILRMGRFAPLFVILVVPVFAASLSMLRDGALRRPMMAPMLATLLAIVIARVAISFPAAQPLDAFLNRHAPPQDGYPTDAAAYVSDRIAPRSGRLINEFSWGGYLAWRLGDRYQVLLDGRTQLYTSEFWNAAYLGSEGDRRLLLESASADAAVLPVGASKFRETLKSLGWSRTYGDSIAEVWQPPVIAASSD